MAGAGKKTFAVNEVLSAADVNNYLMDQSVMRFADSTARSSAIGTPSEGMVSYLDDSNQVEVFDGSSWVNFTGDINQVTAGTALTGGGTEGNVTLNADISAISTAQAGTALTASGETLNVDETELFTGGTEGFTALSNGTAGLSYQPVSHNYIINGAFDIWQRGDGPTQIVSGSFLADRFLLYAQGPDFDVSKSTDTPDNFDFSTKIQRDSGSTDTSQATMQYIPEDAGRILAGKEFTISFYAKVGADFSGSLRLSVASTSAEPQNISKFSSGQIRSDNPDYNSSLLINPIAGLTTSWQRFSYTGTLDSLANGVQLFMGFVPSGTAGADDSFYTTGWQLETGSIATPFKRNANSIQGELAACQRYYVRFGNGTNGNTFAHGYARNSTTLRALFNLPTTMRIRPENIEFGGAIMTFITTPISVTNITFSERSPDTVHVSATTSGLTTGEYRTLQANTDPDAFVAFEAEL